MANIGRIKGTEDGILVPNTLLLQSFANTFDEYVYHIKGGNLIITPVSDEYDARILYSEYTRQMQSSITVTNYVIDGLRVTMIRNKGGQSTSVITKEETPQKIAECIALLRLLGQWKDLEKFEDYIVKA